MELFKKIAELLSEGEDLNIVARKKADGKMIVSVLLETGDKNVSIPPFILRGTPDELDAGFIAALEPTLASASGLVVDTKAAKEAVDKAAKKKQEEAAPKKSSSSAKKTDSKAKPAETESSLIPDADPEENATGGEETDPAPVPAEEAPVQEEKKKDAPVQQEEAATAPEPVEEAPAETPEKPSAPEAKDVIRKDVNTLWAEGKGFYEKGDYKNALRVFEQCRSVAKENQYATIDKAIDNCTAKLASDLFNSQS